jgi:outer membrane receptor protein involved in Fe transport
LWKGGLTIRKDKCFDISLTAVYASDQYWRDSDLASSTTPAKIAAYKVLDLSGDWYITKRCRLIAAISNLTNEKYYSRVFLNGLIQPAPQRAGYAGLSFDF